jgi:hypothetical protein
MNPVEQAVGHNAFLCLVTIGYLVFAAGWIVVTLAIMSGLLDLTSTIAGNSEPRRSSSPVLARGYRVDRLSPASARKDLAPVLAFAPRKTRNRLVVR